jgi:hypothetical protein
MRGILFTVTLQVRQWGDSHCCTSEVNRLHQKALKSGTESLIVNPNRFTACSIVNIGIEALSQKKVAYQSQHQVAVVCSILNGLPTKSDLLSNHTHTEFVCLGNRNRLQTCSCRRYSKEKDLNSDERRWFR